MVRRTWCVLIFAAMLATALPLSSSTEAPSLLADQEETLLVGDDAHLAFRPDGNGWGRIVLEATEEVALDFTLTHDTITDFDWGRDGREIYEGGENHTFIHFFKDGTSALSSDFWFHWWGDPNIGWWPHSGWRWGDNAPLELAAGERAVLVVADNVGGYTITITGETPGAAETVEWTTASHPGMLTAQPDEERPFEVGTEQAGVRDRSWTTSWNASAGDVLSAAAWDFRSGSGTTVGVYFKDSVGWGGTPSSSFLLPGLSLSFGDGGGYSASKSTRIGTALDDGGIDFFREMSEAKIDTRGELAGAQFLVLPVGPLS